MKETLLFASRRLCLVLSLAAGPMALADARFSDTRDHRCRPMNSERLNVMIQGIDSGAIRRNNLWQFNVKGRPILIIIDVRANRFRAMTQVVAAAQLAPDQMTRLMQANFDSTLDARYALQGGQVWSAFVHPLDSLTERQFLSGVDQVINLVETFGDSYSSGIIMFRGGDSPDIEQKKYEREQVKDRLL